MRYIYIILLSLIIAGCGDSQFTAPNVKNDNDKVMVVEENNGYSIACSPVPASDHIEIFYELPVQSLTIVSIRSLLGKELKILSSSYHEAGNHAVYADISDLPEGPYMAYLESGSTHLKSYFTVMRK